MISQEKARSMAGFTFLLISVLGFWLPQKYDWSHSAKILVYIFATFWGLCALQVAYTAIFKGKRRRSDQMDLAQMAEMYFKINKMETIVSKFNYNGIDYEAMVVKNDPIPPYTQYSLMKVTPELVIAVTIFTYNSVTGHFHYSIDDKKPELNDLIAAGIKRECLGRGIPLD